MSDPRTPIYTEEDLRIINQARRQQFNLDPIDIYGDPVTAAPAETQVQPRPTPQQPEDPEARSAFTAELEQFGQPLTPTVEYRRDQMEQAFDSLVQQRAGQALQDRSWEGDPLFEGIDESSPEFPEVFQTYIREKTLRDTAGDTQLVPGFAYEDWSPRVNGNQVPMSAERTGFQVLEPAPPMELPAQEEPTLMTALSPQSRLGEAGAERIERLSAANLKTPEQYVQSEGINIRGHIDYSERDRLRALQNYRNLTPEENEQLTSLEASVGSKERFDDINDYSSYVGFYSAYQKEMAKDPTQDPRELAQRIQAELQELPLLISGQAPDDRYTEHRIGDEGPSDPWYRAFSAQIQQGRVPNLTDVQKEYLTASTPIRRQAYVDIIPYLEQENRETGYTGDPEQPIDLGAIDNDAPEDPSPYERPPEPISLEEAEENYSQWITQRGLTDYYAIDFWEDPEKYAEGWSWWNRSYPSGASVEGPAQHALRSIMAPLNITSRVVYDVLEPIAQIPIEGDDETATAEALRRGEAPKLYEGHPYLRNIAENRGLMNDAYDLYYYNGYENAAYAAGGAGLLVDIFVTPFDPGVSALVKGSAGVARGARLAKALGYSYRPADIGMDFGRGAFRAVADQSPALAAVGNRIEGLRVLDPIEYGATRGADFINGGLAYRRAYDDALRAGLEGAEAHERAINGAYEIVGKRNRFLDEAGREGAEWAGRTSQNLGKEAGDIGRQFDEYVDGLQRYASGQTNQLPNTKLTRRLVAAVEDEGAFIIHRGVKNVEGRLLPVIDESLTVGDKVRRIYSNPKLFGKMLEPLNYRVATKGVIDALETSKITRSGLRSLRMVTPGLFVDANNLKKLAGLTKTDGTMNTLVKIMDEAEAKVGLYPSYDPRMSLAGQKQSYRPKTGSYFDLSVSQAKQVEEIVKQLAREGVISLSQYREIMAGLKPKLYANLYAKGKSVGDVGMFSGRSLISTENMRTVVGAQLEKLAYTNKIGVETRALETATTATKVALLEPIASRYLAQSWPRRFFSRFFGNVKNATKWKKEYVEGMPLQAAIELTKLRGKLASMDVVLRRDIVELMNSAERQAQYFDEAWLAENKVTRNDAIVALALGPKSGRSLSVTDYSLNNLFKILVQKSDDLALDTMDMFRSSSISRTSAVLDTLTDEGRTALKNILLKYTDEESLLARELSAASDEPPRALGRLTEEERARLREVRAKPLREVTGQTIRGINGQTDWNKFMTGFHNDLENFIKTPENFNTTKQIQLASPDFPNITAGFYYQQQMRRLGDETIGDIYRNFEGLDDIAVAQKGFSDMIRQPAMDWTELPVPAIGRLAAEEAAGQPVVVFGDYLNRRINTLLEYRATPTLKSLLYRTPEEDWARILTDMFGDKLEPDEITQIAKLCATEDSSNVASFRAAVMNAHDYTSNIAHRIIVTNGLNKTNMTENLSALGALVERVRGKPTVVSYKKPAIQRDIERGGKKFKEVLEDVGIKPQDIRDPEVFTDSAITLDSTMTADEMGEAIEEARRSLLLTTEQFQQLGRAEQELMDVLEKHVMGAPIRGEVLSTTGKVRQVSQIREALQGLFKTDKTVGYKTLKTIDASFQWLTRMRYQALLGSRVAFHAVNVVSAPTIIWGTLGGRASMKSITSIKKAHDVWQQGWRYSLSPRELDMAGVAPEGQKFMEGMGFLPEGSRIAVVDPFGRRYTYRDVWDMAIGTSALRSQTKLILSAGQVSEILDDARFTPEYRGFVKENMARLFGGSLPQAAIGMAAALPESAAMAASAGWLGASVIPKVERLGRETRLTASPIGKFLANMTEYEDQYFRLTQVIDGLEQGVAPEIALAQGRRALYDYGSLTAPEKWAVSRFVMFWAFFRLNMENFIGVMMSNPKRFANIHRTLVEAPQTLNPDKNLNYGTAELNFYKHHFLLTRPMISYIEGADSTSHYQVLPAVPILDAATTVAEMLNAPDAYIASQPLRDFIDPSSKFILGQRSRIQWKKPYVDPKDMYILDNSGWSDYFWDTLIMERPEGRSARAGQEYYLGQNWYLSPEGMERYLYYKNVLGPFLTFPNVLSSDTLALTHMTGVDVEGMFGKSFGEAGEGAPEAAAGVVRDIGTIPVSSQQAALLREIERRLKEIEQAEAQR